MMSYSSVVGCTNTKDRMMIWPGNNNMGFVGFPTDPEPRNRHPPSPGW